MANQGWVKSHRSILDHWVFEDPFMLKVWIHLFHAVNHTDAKVPFNGFFIDIKRGSFITSQEKLCKIHKCSRGRISRSLNRLKTDGMIDIKTDSQKTIITICNYNEYQSNENTNSTTDNTSGSTTDGTTNGQPTVQRTDTNKNDQEQYKNEKNERERGTPPAHLNGFPKIPESSPNPRHFEVTDEYTQKAATEFDEPSNQPWTKTNAYITAGRQPMKTYPNLWLTPGKLVEAMKIFDQMKLPRTHWKKLFLEASSKVENAVINDSKSPDKIDAYSWLTGFVLTNALNQYNEEVKINRNKGEN